jgi:hypothetical protein
MNTTAKNILSLLAPVLLLVFGLLALRAGILSNHAGPAITGLLCLMLGTTTLYWWLENMLYPPLVRWFRQQRALKAQLEEYRRDQEGYAAWEDSENDKAEAQYQQFLRDYADFEQSFETEHGPEEDYDLEHEDPRADHEVITYIPGDHDEDEGTSWMSIWWDEENLRQNIEF